MLIDSISSVKFIPLNIQKHLNYININTNTEINNFLIYLYNYYHSETLHKLTMYTIVNNIYNKITKIIKSVFQYFYTQ